MMSESTKFGMTTVKSAMRRAEKPAPFPQRGPKPPYELVRSFMPRPLRLIARVLDQHLDRSALQSAECDRARKHLLLALSGLIGVTALLIAGFSYRLPAAGLWLLAIMFVANVRLLLRAKTVGADGVKRDTRAGALALWCLLALGAGCPTAGSLRRHPGYCSSRPSCSASFRAAIAELASSCCAH